MALTAQEQIDFDNTKSDVLTNSGNITKNQADIQGIDNESYLRLIIRSFVFSGCEITKSASDLSISLSIGSDSESITFIIGKYLKIKDATTFIAQNTSGSTRIDLIYLTKEGSLFIKSGVAGSGSAPSLPSNSLEIYTITIPTNTTSNLASCTLNDRRIQARSGHYLPNTGITKNESFLLTQQDGANAPGLYYYNTSWNFLSSGGLAGNYYIKAEVDVLSSAMTEAEFRANQNENKKNRGGSGFDKFGTITGENVNKGLKASGSTLSIAECEISVNGISIKILEQSFSYPDAQTDANARQDFLGFEVVEYSLSDIDFVFNYGNIRIQNSTMSGITTVTASFSGAIDFCKLGNWDTSGVIGKGLVWSTLSTANKQKILSDPFYNAFLGEDGEYKAVFIRPRKIKGLTSNGAEWFNFIGDTNANATLIYSSGINWVKPKGILSAIDNDTNIYSYDQTGFYINTVGTGIEINKGIFYAGNQGGSNSSIDTSISYKGNCFMLPIAMVSRNRNQGGYHPVYNPMGTKTFTDGAWNVTALATSLAACLNVANLLTVSGYISSGVSGRPDGLYYDEINQLDVRDLRLPTNYDGTVDTELARNIKAEDRGYEAEFELKYVNPVSATLDVANTESAYGVTLTRLIFNGEMILGINTTLGDVSYLDNNYRMFIKGDTKYYECSLILTDITPNSFVRLHPRYGDVTADFTVTNKYSVVVSVRTDRFQNNTQQRCEILGDPANYTFSSHVGVANLIDVNDGTSQLPEDITTGATYSHCKVFRLASKYSGVSKVLIDDVEIIPSSGYQTTTSTYALPGSSPENNKIVINFTDTFATLGYASDLLMAQGCVIEVFYDGYSSNLVPSVNLVVEDRKITDAYSFSDSLITQGASQIGNLLSKIGLTTGNLPSFSKKGLDAYVFLGDSALSHVGKLNNSYQPSHQYISLFNINVPSIKVFLYQTNKDGLLYNVIVFKEMKFAVTWGDDQKFDITDNIKTKTDDNGNVIIYGTVISKNPVGFAKVSS